MSGWKLVPVEPTPTMLAADVVKTIMYGEFYGDIITVRSDVPMWKAMLSASPDPTEDEALVERVARVIAKICNAEDHWDLFRDEAIAAIRAMEEKP